MRTRDRTSESSTQWAARTCFARRKSISRAIEGQSIDRNREEGIPRLLRLSGTIISAITREARACAETDETAHHVARGKEQNYGERAGWTGVEGREGGILGREFDKMLNRPARRRSAWPRVAWLLYRNVY